MSEPLSLGIAQAAAASAAAEPDSERVLLERLAAGGDARRLAVGTLYRRFEPRFRRYFQAQRLGEAEAEDLVQDVFVKVVRACGEFRGESRADTWLWTIARNTLISKLRARQPETSLEEFDLDAPPPIRICKPLPSRWAARWKTVSDTASPASARIPRSAPG